MKKLVNYIQMKLKGIRFSSYQSLTKWQNTKKALVNTVTVGVSEVVFFATIEWE